MTLLHSDAMQVSFRPALMTSLPHSALPCAMTLARLPMWILLLLQPWLNCSRSCQPTLRLQSQN